MRHTCTRAGGIRTLVRVPRQKGITLFRVGELQFYHACRNTRRRNGLKFVDGRNGSGKARNNNMEDWVQAV